MAFGGRLAIQFLFIYKRINAKLLFIIVSGLWLIRQIIKSM